MKRIALFSALALALALASCGQSAPKTGAVSLSSDTDPVCGMKVDAATTDTAHYQGQVYGFCNPSCQEEFVANPQAFLSPTPGK